MRFAGTALADSWPKKPSVSGNSASVMATCKRSAPTVECLAACQARRA
jgi:hypothetical protein